jgi:hypothetical protein
MLYCFEPYRFVIVQIVTYHYVSAPIFMFWYLVLEFRNLFGGVEIAVYDLQNRFSGLHN